MRRCTARRAGRRAAPCLTQESRDTSRGARGAPGRRRRWSGSSRDPPQVVVVSRRGHGSGHGSGGLRTGCQARCQSVSTRRDRRSSSWSSWPCISTRTESSIVPWSCTSSRVLRLRAFAASRNAAPWSRGRGAATSSAVACSPSRRSWYSLRTRSTIAGGVPRSTASRGNAASAALVMVRCARSCSSSPAWSGGRSIAADQRAPENCAWAKELALRDLRSLA